MKVWALVLPDTQISVAEDHTQAVPPAEPALLSQLWTKLSCVGVFADATGLGHRVPCLPHASSVCPAAQLGPSAWGIPVPTCM